MEPKQAKLGNNIQHHVVKSSRSDPNPSIISKNMNPYQTLVRNPSMISNRLPLNQFTKSNPMVSIQPIPSQPVYLVPSASLAYYNPYNQSYILNPSNFYQQPHSAQYLIYQPLLSARSDNINSIPQSSITKFPALTEKSISTFQDESDFDDLEKPLQTPQLVQLTPRATKSQHSDYETNEPVIYNYKKPITVDSLKHPSERLKESAYKSKYLASKILEDMNEEAGNESTELISKPPLLTKRPTLVDNLKLPKEKVLFKLKLFEFLKLKLN